MKKKRLPRIGSPAWHREFRRNAENPMNAWQEDWGFESRCIIKAVIMIIVGLFFAYSIYPFDIKELCPFLIIMPFIWSGVIIVRRNAMHRNYKNRDDYLRYREWRKTQPWVKDADRIIKEIHKNDL